MREDVGEDPLRFFAGAGGEEDGERDEEEGAHAGVAKHLRGGVAFALTAYVGVGHRQADHKGESGHDEVPEPATDPGAVLPLGINSLPERGVGGDPEVEVRSGGETEAAEGEAHHNKAAIGIEADEAGAGGGSGGRHGTIQG